MLSLVFIIAAEGNMMVETRADVLTENVKVGNESIKINLLNYAMIDSLY